MNYYFLQDYYGKDLKKIWLARSEKPLILQNEKQLTMGVDGYAHIEYMWPSRKNFHWTIGKFKNAKVTYHFSSPEDLLHELKHLSQDKNKWICLVEKSSFNEVQNFITSTL